MEQYALQQQQPLQKPAELPTPTTLAELRDWCATRCSENSLFATLPIQYVICQDDGQLVVMKVYAYMAHRMIKALRTTFRLSQRRMP